MQCCALLGTNTTTNFLDCFFEDVLGKTEEEVRGEWQDSGQVGVQVGSRT